MSGHRLADMRWPEVRPVLEAGATAVLPIGSAAKEHGPHLPMATDWLQAEALGRHLAARASVLVWPTVGYGFYPAFVDYPGSTSLPRDTFRATLDSLLEDLSRAGARRALVVNTGISTIGPVDEAVALRPGAAAVHVYRGPRYLAALAALTEQARGGHADEAETSIMLHLHPDRVDMARAPTWVERAIPPGIWSPSDPESPRYSPSGIAGDASLATADKGRRLFEAMLEDALRALDGAPAG